MQIVNLSAEPLGKLHSWMPHDLEADRVIFLPDACPGKSPLPTGTAVLTRQTDWRRFAVSDCGCGMRLVKSAADAKDLDLARWSHLADLLRANKGGLGDLGGGNHFLDAIAPYEDGPLYDFATMRKSILIPLGVELCGRSSNSSVWPKTNSSYSQGFGTTSSGSAIYLAFSKGLTVAPRHCAASSVTH